MSIRNNKQDKNIEKLKTDTEWLKLELKEIKEQVYNDIPHSIQDLKDKIFLTSVIGVVSIIIVQLILKFLI